MIPGKQTSLSSPEPVATVSAAQRRRQGLMLDTVQVLVGLGRRDPGSLAEAQAAAVINGRLRNAGMEVAVEPFHTNRRRDGHLPLIGLAAPLLAIAYGITPVVASISLLALLLIEVVLLQNGSVSARHASQNVVATRAAHDQAKQRLILLAALDAPPLLHPLVVWFAGPSWGVVVRRVGALVTLVVLALLGLAYGHPIWWYLQAVPSAYLLATGLCEILRLRSHATPGAVSYAASAAVLLASAERLTDLRFVELWLIMLGATTASEAGLNDLLGRYPFERDQTLVIALDGIGVGRLTGITREGPRGRVDADATLLRLAAMADADDPTIDMEPRPYRAAPTLITGLLRLGWRGMSIATLDLHGRVPLRHSAADVADQVSQQVLERTLRLVVGIARQLDRRSGAVYAAPDDESGR